MLSPSFCSIQIMLAIASNFIYFNLHISLLFGSHVINQEKDPLIGNLENPMDGNQAIRFSGVSVTWYKN